MKPLIVGEAPSKNEVTERPLEGRVGRRLAKCCGLSFEDYLERFVRVNLLHVRQDTKEHGFLFDLPAAKKEAAQLMTSFARGQIVLLLGGRVAEAFGVHDHYFAKVALGKAEAYILPHPSGVNRWYNDVSNVMKMETFMRGIVERTRA